VSMAKTCADQYKSNSVHEGTYSATGKNLDALTITVDQRVVGSRSKTH